MSYLKLYDYFPFEIDHCKGVEIFTKDGKKYIDSFSGIGVLSFGHSYDKITELIKTKLNRYSHLSNFFLDEDTEYVAKKLIKYTNQSGKVFFSNSGTEANEGILKTIRKISDETRNQIIYFDQGFHGRTTGSLSVTGFPKIKDCFKPLLQPTVKLPYNNVKAINEYFENYHSKTIALFMEPVQGSGGVIPLTKEFADTINSLHKKHKFVLVSDEIQAGLGRAGKIYSYQHFNIKPDIISVSKSLGGGLPLGAILFLGKYADVLKPGDHGSTFAPNPLALVAAKYILDTLPGMLQDIVKKGDYFSKKLSQINSNKIKIIRGKGLMIGVVLKEKHPELRNNAMKEGLLLNILQDKIIRLLPALNITYDEIDQIILKLGKIL